MLKTPLSPETRRELLALKNRKTTHPKTSERIEMLLLADAGWTHDAIAAHLGRSCSLVQLRIRAYETQGIETLGVNYGPRRARKATPEYQAALVAKLDEDRIWTSAQLADALAEQTGIRLGIDHLRVLVKRHGYTWKRTKRSVAHSRKPEVYEARREVLDGLKKTSRRRHA